MAIFPTDDPATPAADRKRLRPVFDGYSTSFITSIKRTESEAGKSKIKDVWNRDRFSVDQCEFLVGPGDYTTLMRFWKANRSAEFTFYDFLSWEYSESFTADGTITTFTLNAVETRDHVVTGGGSFTISERTGPLGEDQIVFDAAPAAGTVTVDYEGRKQYPMEFLIDPATASVGYRLFEVIFSMRESL